MSPKVANELALLLEQSGGLLLPSAVVAFARDPATALHAEFEWDDTAAAERWRLEQARAVIRVHFTVIGEEPEPIRTFVSLTTDRVTGGGYRALADVLNDPAMAQQLLRDALMELRAVQARYERVKALGVVWDAIARASQGDSPGEAMQASG